MNRYVSRYEPIPPWHFRGLSRGISKLRAKEPPAIHFDLWMPVEQQISLRDLKLDRAAARDRDRTGLQVRSRRHAHEPVLPPVLSEGQRPSVASPSGCLSERN